MDFLLNPNIAYLLLVVTTFLILTAIAVPGTGIPEISALFSLVLAGYAVYHLSFNGWALALLLLSVVPFFFAVRGPRREMWLALSIIGLTVGSVFFFPAQQGFISVNPVLAVVTSGIYAAFLWVSIRKILQIAQTKPIQDISTLIGARGETKTPVQAEGSVQVVGELWSARSEKPIPAGEVVRIIGREGFVLTVEKDDSSDK
jgi:membrane-bound serine protease (ClpP class)